MARMISPKYRELDKEKFYDNNNQRYSDEGNKYNKRNATDSFQSKYGKRLIFLMALFFLLWLIVNYLLIDVTESQNLPCDGNACQKEICEQVANNKMSGNLCTDLCFDETFKIPDCPDNRLYAGDHYKYYNMKPIESSYVCPSINSKVKLIEEQITYADLEYILTKKIGDRLHHPLSVQMVVSRVLKMVDVNHDGKIDLTEANNLWLLLNNKHTFYMLVLENKSYIPEIKDFCGSFVEIEQILNQVILINKKTDSLINSVFPMKNFQWFMLDWNYRCKISIGILEFFLDSVSFNPNDEFGDDSLYLCSPIEHSFASTFLNEAKLVNYDEVMNGRDLRELLAEQTCYSDEDCIYTKQCQTRCDIKTNLCTSELVKPQVAYFCTFLRDYLLDNTNVTETLEPLIERCEKLESFGKYSNSMYIKNERPMNYEHHKIFVKQLNYWNNSNEYALVTNKLMNTLWEYIKLAKDPQKKKKVNRNKGVSKSNPK